MVDSAIALDTHKDATTNARGRTDTDRRERGVRSRRVRGRQDALVADEGTTLAVARCRKRSGMTRREHARGSSRTFTEAHSNVPDSPDTHELLQTRRRRLNLRETRPFATVGRQWLSPTRGHPCLPRTPRCSRLRAPGFPSLRVARLLIGDRLLQHGRIDLHAGLRQRTLQEHFAGAISADERGDLALAVQHELGGDAADAVELA